MGRLHASVRVRFAHTYLHLQLPDVSLGDLTLLTVPCAGGWVGGGVRAWVSERTINRSTTSVCLCPLCLRQLHQKYQNQRTQWLHKVWHWALKGSDEHHCAARPRGPK